ncbi:dehydrogenase/reductase [Mycobacteroides abscessus subsp. bolletii]|uniref:oxidoreductase n=1 Tax=Mycobacteroides abscessus TaxID=36809 RepID=UPI000927C0F1|nr:oxidoreductase [Mycobacteroides abscessus]MDM2346380.1 oxidoreductase [Mycobacteroides abscessus]MDM2358272.1 oxidoreductase [Mycobacteroides abscessus]QSN51349.1 SDR family NAD(P)-dependent oxidoreductase [Mycobacteroides abscessus subsp. abscessus]SHX47750.1 dehydrogenase/reductase [Mycobacteroides abscessus subsp. bolletii]SIH15343.1 dehydrogenase/reductase [Mycobacteroides abscessus subsp. abscessus]
MSNHHQGLPDLAGKNIVITGANGDLGAECATVLARQGARVVLACRNIRTAMSVASRIGGNAAVEQLDLASLASVRAFAERFDEPIDVLVNNAGIMMVPEGRTTDGFENTFGVNHLGHFALTGLLLDRIRERVVTVSSLAHLAATRRGLADPNFQSRRYNRRVAYSNSKIGNLLFARELNRRLAAAGSPLISVAAHPGVVSTGLYDNSELSFADKLKPLVGLMGGSLTEGANPIVRAAVGADVKGGDYFGPAFGFRGTRAVRSPSNRLSRNPEQARQLWRVSEQLTEVRYPLPA